MGWQRTLKSPALLAFDNVRPKAEPVVEDAQPEKGKVPAIPAPALPYFLDVGIAAFQRIGGWGPVVPSDQSDCIEPGENLSFVGADVS